MKTHIYFICILSIFVCTFGSLLSAQENRRTTRYNITITAPQQHSTVSAECVDDKKNCSLSLPLLKKDMTNAAYIDIRGQFVPGAIILTFLYSNKTLWVDGIRETELRIPVPKDWANNDITLYWPRAGMEDKRPIISPAIVERSFHPLINLNVTVENTGKI